MSIVLYYLSGSTPRCQIFDDDQTAQCAERGVELIKQGFTHVAATQQSFEQVGATDRGGIVSGGKLPSGEDYEWSKAHRAGAKQQKEIIKK
jgi:hypothetical protein